MVESEESDQQKNLSKQEDVKDDNIVETTFIGENKWKNWSDEQKEQRKREIFALAEAFTYFTQHTDEFRHELSSNSGGFELRDQAQQDLLRSALTEILTVSFR